MKINSLLTSIPGLKCTVKRSKLWKLIAYEIKRQNRQITKFISLLKFPGLQYLKDAIFKREMNDWNASQTCEFCKFLARYKQKTTVVWLVVQLRGVVHRPQPPFFEGVVHNTPCGALRSDEQQPARCFLIISKLDWNPQSWKDHCSTYMYFSSSEHSWTMLRLICCHSM